MKKILAVFFALLISWSIAFAASPVYVWDESTQDDADATWNSSTIAYVTLAAALAAVDAGGTIYVASDHTEAGGSFTFGSANDNVTCITLKRADDTYETMVTGVGSITTGAGGDFIFNKSDTYNGLYFISDDNITINASDIRMYFINCKILCNDSFAIGGSNQDISMYWEDVDWEITSNNGGMNLNGGDFDWCGGSFDFTGGGVVTTSPFTFNAAGGGDVTIRDVTFNSMDGGDYLVDKGNNCAWNILFKRCKVPAALGGLSTGTITGRSFKAKFHSVSNVDDIYPLEEQYYEGSAISNVVTYLDASYDGTNGYSAEMTSSASAKIWQRPLRFKLTEIYITATGKVITVELITTSAGTATTLHTNDAWIEIEYPDATTGALGNILSTREVSPVGAGTTELTASAKGAGDWVGELTDTNFYKIDIDFTTVADEAIGVYTVWACLAIPSETAFFCPKMTVN